MNSTDNFKEILNRKFSEIEGLPPENDWELFKSKFDLKISRNRLYHRLSYISAIVVVFIIATVIILHRNNDHKISPAQNLPVKSQQDKNQVSKPGKNNKLSADTTFSGNPTKGMAVSKPQYPKRKETLSPNDQILQINKTRIQHSDMGVKKSTTVLKEVSPEKASQPTQQDLQNINSNKNDQPVIIAKSENNLQDRINHNTGPVVNKINNTDSLQVSKRNINSLKSDLTSPNFNQEKIEPDVVNVITPNGDGINDKLVVKNIDLFAPCKINIFDSWGEKIYSSSNYQNNWDGTSKGKLVPEGTYYYVLVTKDGKVYKGAVNILK